MFAKQSSSRAFSVLLVVVFMLTLVGPVNASETPASLNIPPVYPRLTLVSYPAVPSTLLATSPTPIYSITWTATYNYLSDVTEVYPTDPNTWSRRVKTGQIRMTGSAIYRRIDIFSPPDYFPFNLTVTDDEDFVITGNCYPSSGEWNIHSTQSITDPNRYTGGPDLTWYPFILPPEQRPDGSWYMHDPFLGFGMYQFHPFNYKWHEDDLDCDGTRTTSDNLISDAFYYMKLEAPGNLEGDAQGKVFTKKTAFGYPNTTIQWDVTVRVLENRDLTVDRLEVTQGLQDGGNTLPLVQGRRTVVRAYLGVGKEQVPVPGVTGKLSAYAGSTLLGSVPPKNPGGQITAPVTPDWQQINQTLNFELPYEWTLQPSLRLEVEVNSDHKLTEDNYDNNKLNLTMTFLPCAEGINITYLPIRYMPPGGFSPSTPSNNIKYGAEFMLKIYPVPENKLIYSPHSKITWKQNINLPGNNALLMKRLVAIILSSGVSSTDRSYGWLPSNAYGDIGYAESIPGVAAFGNDTETPDFWRLVFAHEIGHTYGLNHDDLTTGGLHWFDAYDYEIKPGISIGGNTFLKDFMNKGPYEEDLVWISPQNYERFINFFCPGSTTTPKAATQSIVTTDTLLVTGTIDTTTPSVSSLDPLYHFTTIPTYILPVGTQYCVNLKSAGDILLGQYCFNANLLGESDTLASTIPFGMVVPYPAGLNRVELVKGASVLSTQIASLSPPGVTVTFPNSAGLTLNSAQDITWTGTDIDLNPLTYNILYSRDNGITWMGVDSGITGSAYNIDFSDLPGTAGASGRIKVMVSDGFNSAEDSSDNPFTIANKPPEAVIVSPSSGAEFTTGPKVVLEGAGMDLENSSLSDSALNWTSSIDGALGTGRLLEVNLSPGVHTITLTATDSDGLTNLESIQITVMDPPLAVVSILRADSNPTSANSVNFNVKFSESVTGVDAGDFTLTTSGVSNSAVSGFSGTGNSYTVTVNTGSGNGTIRLDVVDDDSIKGAANNPLGGVGSGNGNFTWSEIYTINKGPIFGDVSSTYWAGQFIERLYGAGITGGCTASPLNYCPESEVTRAQMAIFLEKGTHYPSSFTPANVAPTFNDTVGHWAEDWIEALKSDGITSGCGTDLYCPENPVTRAQMAIFLLKAKHGVYYTPPAATGVFTDVPVGYWADKWIEQLAAEGITGGCATGLYCPDSPVTRAQMAVFLVKTFGLP